MEILNALREAEENVFWIDDENDDDFFVSALSISNPDFPDLEETKQTPSFLRLLELFEVLFVEEEAAILHKLEELFLHDDDKANMIENFTMFFLLFLPKKKYPTQNSNRDLRFILSF